MNVDLTIEQYEALVKMLSIAEWTINAHDTDPTEYNDSRFKEVFQHILGYAEEFGFSDFIQEDQYTNEIYLSKEFEENSGIFEFIEAYDEEVFWEELIHRLAHRDFTKFYGEQAVTKMAIEERIEKEQPYIDLYANEFTEKGVENLKLSP